MLLSFPDVWQRGRHTWMEPLTENMAQFTNLQYNCHNVLKVYNKIMTEYSPYKKRKLEIIKLKKMVGRAGNRAQVSGLPVQYSNLNSE